MAEAKKSLIRRFFGGLWRLLTWLRVGLSNLVFLVLIILLFATFSERLPEPIQANSALLLNPVGVVVDQKSYEDPLQILFSQSNPSEREVLLRDIIKAIELAAEDEAINSLVLDFSQLYFVGLSKSQEIAQALRTFKATGKEVVAVGTMFNQDQYYLASHADQIYLHPLGSVLLEGYSSYQNYFAEALDKLKINMHVFKAGNYKSAVEPFTRNSMSEYAAEANYLWLSQLWQGYISTVTEQRDMTADNLADYINNYDVSLDQAGGSMADAALKAGLVDAIKNRHEVNQALVGIVGGSDEEGRYRSVAFENYLTLKQLLSPKTDNSTGDKVGIIVARGTILDGHMPDGVIGGDTMAGLIEQARTDNTIDAVVLRVDSGGGSLFASEIIKEQMDLLVASGKPVVVSMGAVAASGGYWIAANADQIWAMPSTLTGSIGVFAAFPTLEGSLAELGIHTDGVGTTELAGGLRVDRDLSPVATAALQHNIEYSYQLFLDTVATGRDMSPAEVDTVAQGRVWTGQAALEKGLVDHLGGLNQATQAAAELAGLDSYEVTYVQQTLSPQEMLLKQLSGEMSGFMARTTPGWLAGLHRALAPLKQQLQWFGHLNDPVGLYAQCLPCQSI